jgi:uncharacterized protein (TIGR02300 family)
MAGGRPRNAGSAVAAAMPSAHMGEPSARRRADLLLTGWRPCGNGAPTDPDKPLMEWMVAKPEWGTKRICPTCGTRYYDLLRKPVICPKCSTPFDPEAFLKSRRARPVAPVEKELEPIGAEELDADVETEEADVAGEEEEALPLAEAEEEDEELLEDASELGEDEDDMAEVIENVEEDEP